MLRILREPALTFGAAVALGAAVWAGCGDDKKSPVTPGGGSPTTTTFSGAYLNGTENGSLNVTINSVNLSPRLGAPFRNRFVASSRRISLVGAATVTATGVLKPVGGGSINLTGAYNEETDSLGLSNVGLGYVFAGTYDTTGTYSAILGQYSGPNGNGFFGCVTGLTARGDYCGTFDSGVTSTAGNWDVLVTGGEVAGIAFPSAGDPFSFEGTIETTGTMRDITAGDGEPGVYQLTVTGTLDTTTNTMSGTWTYEDLITPSTDSGTWSGSLCPQ